MEQSLEVQKSLISSDERLTTPVDRLNEFIPDINTKVDNLSMVVHRLELQIQPLVAENRDTTERINKLELQVATKIRDMTEKINKLELQVAAENRDMTREINKLEMQVAAENRDMTREINKLEMQVTRRINKLELQMIK